MRRFRLSRFIAIATMLGSSFALAGGTVLATAGPASASSAGGGQTCTTLNASGSLEAFPTVVTGRLDGCNSNRGGTITAVVDLSGRVTPGSIAWDTGGATSVISLYLGNFDFTGGSCPAVPGMDIVVAATMLITVGGGPYAGTSGTNVTCVDLNIGFVVPQPLSAIGLPTDVALTNLGVVHI
jgi:hypothetical protein